MKLDMNTKLVDYDNNEVLMPDENGENPKPLKLRTVCANALMQCREPEKQTGEMKLMLHELAMKLHKGEVVELAAADVVLLKKHLGESMYSPMVAGQIMKLIEK